MSELYQLGANFKNVKRPDFEQLMNLISELTFDKGEIDIEGGSVSMSYTDVMGGGYPDYVEERGLKLKAFCEEHGIDYDVDLQAIVTEYQPVVSMSNQA